MKGSYQSFVASTMDDERRLFRLSVESLEEFEKDLGKMYKIYLEYVRDWAVAHRKVQQMTPADGNLTFLEILGKEWKFAKCIAISIRSGEQDAALFFWQSLLLLTSVPPREPGWPCSGLSGQMLEETVISFMDSRKREMDRASRRAWEEEGDADGDDVDDVAAEDAALVNYRACRVFQVPCSISIRRD